MINVLIFGTGSTSEYVYHALNENVNVIAYIDNDLKKVGGYKNNILIETPEAIKKYKYDFIIIASQYNDEIKEQLLCMKVEVTKIFEYFIFRDKLDNSLEHTVNGLINSKIDYEMLVTGISYAMWGFDTNASVKKTYNLALGNQDLYYDYKIIKFLLEKYPDRFNKLKYVLIGLSYYSFQYDMSLSSMKSKVIFYNKLLKDSHNLEMGTIGDLYERNVAIAEKIFKITNGKKFDLNIGWVPLSKIENKEQVGESQAIVDCNKDYPLTVQEYKKVLEDYILMLKENNIKPILVVFPVTKYYYNKFSQKIEEEFKHIVHEMEGKYNVQFLDCFRLSMFNDDDFLDVSHLYGKGSEKFTKYLNKTINW